MTNFRYRPILQLLSRLAALKVAKMKPSLITIHHGIDIAGLVVGAVKDEAVQMTMV